MNWLDLFWIGIIATIVFGTYLKKKIDFTALIATSLVGLVCFFSGGVEWLIPLLMFFGFGMIFTAYKKNIKTKLRVEQETRTWLNVASNGGAAFWFALVNFFQSENSEALFLALVTAMAVALADTAATELGQIYGRSPRLPINFKKVPVGTPGAVSLPGLFFSLGGSVIISSYLLILGYSLEIFGIIVFLGFFGALLDSFFGCTLEKIGMVDTHGINFATTFICGTTTYLIF
jgi:uncharacterized protein (TIGR00297 family)